MTEQECPTCSASVGRIFEVTDDAKGCKECSGKCIDCSTRFANANTIEFAGGVLAGQHICRPCWDKPDAQHILTHLGNMKN